MKIATGLLLCALCTLTAGAAMAAEIRVLSAGAVEPGLKAAAAAFKKQTGNDVNITFNTAPEIRKIFETHGGKLGATNCVAWMFERKGLLLIPANKVAEEKLMEIVLDAGADDLKLEGDVFQVTCPPEAFNAVSDALTKAGLEPDSKQFTRISSNTVEISDVETAKSVLALMDALDDHDDVQSVAANFTIPDEAMAAIGAG